MLPPILQSPTYGTPVAALTLDGLGICCFNGGNPKHWEVAFLRDTKHRLEITVTELDQMGRVVPNSRPPVVVKQSRLIEFQVSGGSEVHYDHFPKGFFTAQGLPRQMVYDFGWVIDFVGPEVPHGKFVRLIPYSERRVYVTLMTVPNALFYNKHVTQDDVILAPDTAAGSDGGIRIGRSNEEIGAAIYATTPGQIRLIYKDDGTDVVPPMPYHQGHLYDISIRNKDKRDPTPNPGPYVKGDFHDLYNVIQVSGTKQDLYAPPRREMMIDGDCHIVGGGTTSGNLYSLEPLIVNEP